MAADAIKARRALAQSDVAFQANLYSDPNPTRRWLHTTRREWVTAALDAQIAPGARRVLEVGVGAGLFTRHLSSQGCQILAVDINPTFLAGVAALPGVITHQGDLCELDAEGFDLALCSEVLEHLPPNRSQIALQKLCQALRPGGVLVLTTPQAYSTAELFGRLLSLRPMLALAKHIYGTTADLGHTNRLTRSALQAQLRAAGFAIEAEARRALYIPVLAEVGGRPAQAAAAALERVIRDAPILSALVWTQCYVLRRRES